MASRMSGNLRNVFSLTSRLRCMENIKQYRVPRNQMKTTKKDGTVVPEAAVMIPMCQVNNVPYLLFTVRSPRLKTYTGQVAFPGGKVDENENVVDAALRETKEEIGLCPTKVDIWGNGNPVPGRHKDIIITPVIGTITDFTKSDLKINLAEVTEVFAVPLETLCNQKFHYYTQYTNGIVLPVFVADQYKIWGVTAFFTDMFLASLLPEDYKNDWRTKKIKSIPAMTSK